MKQRHLDIIEKQNQFAEKGDFNADIVPFNASKALPVTEKHKYILTNIFSRFAAFCSRSMYMWACFIINTFYLRLRVKGRKNLRGLKGAILTCNHVDNFDNTMVRQAVYRHRLYVTVGWFNNRNDGLGQFLRYCGTLPIPDPSAPKYTTVYRNFDKAVEYYLAKKCFILFYPEQSLWWRYEKPRPFKDGAFHFAAKNNVPVVPMYITWRKNKKRPTLHILPPIFPDDNLSRKENVEAMKNKNYNAVVELAEAQKPLSK